MKVKDVFDTARKATKLDNENTKYCVVFKCPFMDIEKHFDCYLNFRQYVKRHLWKELLECESQAWSPTEFSYNSKEFTLWFTLNIERLPF